MSATIPTAPAVTSWASVAQAAAHYDVSRDTIRRMIARGEIHAERLGPRLIRVDLNSVRTQPLDGAE